MSNFSHSRERLATLVLATRALNRVAAVAAAYPAMTAGVVCAVVGSSAALALAGVWFAIGSLLGAR
jgi:hypothetical protein